MKSLAAKWEYCIKYRKYAYLKNNDFLLMEDLEFLELKLCYRLSEYNDEKYKAAEAAALYFLK
ncbi:hypothetical protein COK39_18085 [Priestia megaterium]|nr:hypothetical protein COK39_18085 [Priestia megaterium]